MERGGALEQFDYFMVRVVRSAHKPERVAGQVERLGTGEKRAFGTGDQLAQLVATWDIPAHRDRSGTERKRGDEDAGIALTHERTAPADRCDTGGAAAVGIGGAQVKRLSAPRLRLISG